MNVTTNAFVGIRSWCVSFDLAAVSVIMAILGMCVSYKPLELWSVRCGGWIDSFIHTGRDAVFKPD